MRLFGWTITGIGVGFVAGAFAGLVVATLINANCDTVTEQFAGCYRAKPGGMALIGGVLGIFLGLGVGVVVGRRYGRKGPARARGQSPTQRGYRD